MLPSSVVGRLLRLALVVAMEGSGGLEGRLVQVDLVLEGVVVLEEVGG